MSLTSVIVLIESWTKTLVSRDASLETEAYFL
jgi:hypothetical protein